MSSSFILKMTKRIATFSHTVAFTPSNVNPTSAIFNLYMFFFLHALQDSLRKKQQPPVSSTPVSSNAPPPPSAISPASSTNIGAVVTSQSFASTAAAAAASVSADAKKKKNRCVTCRKKVGLTGIECRCGGLFCAIHRYSDKHDCSFDYRELGAAEIRRNNPVVVVEKIQKI